MPTRAEQLRIENEETRARLANLEAHVRATPLVSEEERADSLADDSLTDDTFNDPDSSNDSNPLNDPLKDAVAALVCSQQTMMERMSQDSRKQKVYARAIQWEDWSFHRCMA